MVERHDYRHPTQAVFDALYFLPLTRLARDHDGFVREVEGHVGSSAGFCPVDAQCRFGCSGDGVNDGGEVLGRFHADAWPAAVGVCCDGQCTPPQDDEVA